MIKYKKLRKKLKYKRVIIKRVGNSQNEENYVFDVYERKWRLDNVDALTKYIENIKLHQLST